MAKFGGDTGIDADYEQAAADNMIHTGRRDCSCNKCRPSFDSKLADENCISIKDINKEIAKDYKYEHDQINEVWGIRYCPKCGSRLMSSEFGDASSDESTPGYMCQKNCGYSEMIVSDFLGSNHGYSISGDNKDDEEV